jgi:membrane protein implicated in regulation of membrane protease activity
MWSTAVLAKYWALQLPATALVTVVLRAVGDHFAWPQWIVWTIVAAWVAKDAMLYPFLWRAYDPHDPSALPYSIEGARGVAIERIDPSGFVRIWGELWRAELSRGARRIEKGETVQVHGRLGLTLLIGPEADQEEHARGARARGGARSVPAP